MVLGVIGCGCDGIKEWQLGIQDLSSRVGQGIIEFHYDIMVIMIFVVCFVGWMLFRIVRLFQDGQLAGNDKVETLGQVKAGKVEGRETFTFSKEVSRRIEVIWTIILGMLLGIISVLSFGLLYGIEESIKLVMSVKVIGHQWYWSYELEVNSEKIGFDSFIVQEEELEVGQFRLLEVDNRLVLLIKENIRMIITADDVIHCWTVLSLGVKVDSILGRLNEISFRIERYGVFYGQCSEICGINHGFMLIVVESV